MLVTRTPSFPRPKYSEKVPTSNSLILLGHLATVGRSNPKSQRRLPILPLRLKREKVSSSTYEQSRFVCKSQDRDNPGVELNLEAKNEEESSKDDTTEAVKTRSLLQIAASVGFVTALCKVLGTVREMLLAARFGVGPVADAFNYALIVPTFFLAIVGGINGPCHSAVTSALGGTDGPREAREVAEAAATLMGVVLLPVSLLIFFGAAPLIDLASPGLAASGNTLTREIAVQMLRVMAPCAMLSGLVGVAFGTLSHAGVYLIPALSPACTSLTVTGVVVWYSLRHGWQTTASLAATSAESQISVGVLLALGFTAGAVSQWMLQAGTAAVKGLSSPFRLRWLNPQKNPAMKKVVAVLLPACVGSGMLQLATYVDLYFASFIPGAAAAMGYANLLAMAPLGILANSILVPILPRFTQLAAPEKWPELRAQIRQALVVAVGVGLPIGALLCCLSSPLTRVVLMRRAFDATACNRVSALLACYSVGAPVFLMRDVLVRAFYALGDGNVPFFISCMAIGGNAVLDWYFVSQCGLGAPGLVIATVIVNLLSVVAFGIILATRIGSLELARIWKAWISLTFATGAASLAGILTYFGAAPFNVNWAFSALMWLGRSCRLPQRFLEESATPLFMWAADGAMVGLAAAIFIAVYGGLMYLLRIDKASSHNLT